MIRASTLALLVTACRAADPGPGPEPEPEPEPGPDPDATEHADVLEVTTSGSPDAYTFVVTIRSPDTGCDRYADWWEVVSSDGALQYRRILLHSHVDEQPFTRSGRPVPVAADLDVWVRAHLHVDSGSSYGGVALRGSVAKGFEVADASGLPSLADQEPLPGGCAH